jgi:glutamine amidotransferase-like uncharacterized protein
MKGGIKYNMKKNFIMLAFVLMTCVFLAGSVSALTADFAIYTGSGTWDESIVSFENFLDWKGLTWKEINKHDFNKRRLVGNYRGLFMPGGWAGNYNQDIRPSGDQEIRDFISGGGAYIGMSAGAFYACDITIWEGDVLDYPSDMFDGDCIGPIEEIAPWPEYTMTTMNINLNHEANAFEPAQRDVLYYGEPYFVAHPGQEMQVFATYIVPSNPVAHGKPGIIGFNYGNGRIVLSGPHPEIEEDSSRDGNSFGEELSDGPDGSDWPFIWTAVDWMLKEPITQPPGVTPKQCNDGLDNDGDGFVDMADIGCDSPSDDDETDPLPPQCSDGIDNDFDNFTDFPADIGCTDANDNDETDVPITQCNDGIDNDLDGFVDLEDVGCVNELDDDETNPTGPQEVFFDGFENGMVEWSLYGVGIQWGANSESVFEGNLAARAKQTGAGKDSFMEHAIDLSGYSSGTFEYYRLLKGLDVADNFAVEYFDNGWNTLEELGSSSETNSNFVFKSFSIPTSTTAIRFMCEVGAVSEKCFVDNVRVTGE